jgi:methylglutaconyl-CoA hydratase
MSTIHADGSYVNTEIVNGVATIEFFHPKGNAMPGILLSALASAIQQAAADQQTKVILLCSSGEKAFCAGASFEELAAVKNEAEGKIFFSGFAHVINAMRAAPQLIVGRIHSKCVGGGVGIAAACDYVIASEKASIKLSELKIGIGPFVIGPAVERKMGIAAFNQLALDPGNWYSAVWALQKGLFAEVHATDESLQEAVNKKTNELATSSSEAMTEIKKMLWAGTDHWSELLYERAAVSGRLILTDAAKTSVQNLQKDK